jgi:hypothetical protein
LNRTPRTKHGLHRAAITVCAAACVLLVLLAGGESAEAQGKRRRAPKAARSETAESAELAGREVEEDGGKKVKEFRFSGLDVSGRLKSPQILYFLNRLRAEFDRPRLPHRSFMPELVRSSKQKSF